MKICCQKLTKMIFFVRDSIAQRVDDFGAQYFVFGIFGILNYPIFYMVWRYYDGRSYENLTLRMIATMLCVILLFKKYWPKKIIEWFPVYWYLTLLFCLPFFFFFMLFKNGGANEWLMSSNTVLFWLLLVVDWISDIVIFSIGIAIAYVAYLLTTQGARTDSYMWWWIAVQYIASLLIVIFFARNKQQFDQQKLQTIAIMGESVAHELRTPLRIITSAASGLNQYFPQLIETYNIAKINHLTIPNISVVHAQMLKPALDSISTEAAAAFNFINMLLVNANQTKIKTNSQNVRSIVECVNIALSRYPFDLNDRELIHWDPKTDFSFKGDELLVVHILFNLLKNAIYYVKAAGKGNIAIEVDCQEKGNFLYFKDTGQGINAKIVPHVFKRFFSKTHHGTGIGLAYCKLAMQSLGGDITCDSKEFEYTEFKLFFPKKT